MQNKCLFLVVSLALAGSLAFVSASPNAKDLLKIIHEIESIDNRLSPTPKNREQREVYLKALIKDTTPEVLKSYHNELQKNADELHRGINTMIYEHKQKNPFATVSKNWGRFLLNNFNKNFDPEIGNLIQILDAQLNANGDVPEQIVHCSLRNFQIKHLTNIIFLLRTNLKYLLTEDVALENDAIIEKLRSNKWEAQTDFYQNHEFDLEQIDLLNKFYSQNQDITKENVGDAIDHIAQAGNLIVGRILETCKSVNEYSSTIAQVVGETEGCSFTKSNVFGEKTLTQQAVDETLSLCHSLLEH